MNDLIEAHLSALLLDVQRNQRSKATYGARRAVLLLADKQLPQGIDDVSVEEIGQWLGNPDWSRWTSHTYLGHLRAFYTWAVAFGHLNIDPTAGMRAPCGLPRPNPVNAEELRVLLTRTKGTWRACVMLGLGAGLRANEMATIRREDVTADEVHVRYGKGGKERFVATSAVLWAWVQDQPSGLLVRGSGGAAVTGRYLSCKQYVVWRSIGLEGMYLHRLRHTFCTCMWQSKADPLVVRDLMGHTSLTTTEGYAKPRDDAFRTAIGAIDTLLREHQPDGSRLVSAAA